MKDIIELLKEEVSDVISFNFTCDLTRYLFPEINDRYFTMEKNYKPSYQIEFDSYLNEKFDKRLKYTIIGLLYEFDSIKEYEKVTNYLMDLNSCLDEEIENINDELLSGRLTPPDEDRDSFDILIYNRIDSRLKRI